MRRILIMGTILIINLVLQSTIIQNIEINNIKPNTAIVLIISIALLRGSVEGGICGFFAGLLQDIFFGFSIGRYALLGMLCGHYVGKINKGFYRENYITPIVICAIVTFVYELCVYITGPLFQGNTSLLYFLINIILPEAIYNSVFIIIIYRILFSVNNAIEEKEKYKRKLFTMK